jgi:hypothetical protein
MYASGFVGDLTGGVTMGVGDTLILPVNEGNQTTDGEFSFDTVEGVLKVGDGGAATHRFIACNEAEARIVEYSSSGVPSCKVAIQTTITAVADGDIMVGQTADTEFIDVQMGGHATMLKTGAVTVVDIALTAEGEVDALGLEFEESDDISDCSSFSSTGGGIFYDDSDGEFKKCEDNVLTALDTTGAHTGTITWGGTSILESGVAFQFGDGTDATVTHTYGVADTDPTIAYSDDSIVVTNVATYDHEDASVPTADLKADAGITMGMISGSINFVTTGTITGDIDVVVTADTVLSPAATALRGTMHISNDASGTDYTLPDISDNGGVGLSACFYDLATTGADLIVIDPAGDDNFVLDGAALGAGDELHSPADPGNFICILAIDATTWITLGRSGTWINGDA